MKTISHTFQYKIVLDILKILGHLSDNGLWPVGNNNSEHGEWSFGKTTCPVYIG